MMKMNDTVGELKRTKMEVENKLQPLKNEMQRMSDACGRERQTRMSLQNELQMCKEHMQQQERRSHELQNELSTMVSLGSGCWCVYVY